MSNDYKSLLGFWKKLSRVEKNKFIKEYIDNSMIERSVDDSCEALEREIDKALYHRELPAIDFGKSSKTR